MHCRREKKRRREEEKREEDRRNESGVESGSEAARHSDGYSILSVFLVVSEIGIRCGKGIRLLRYCLATQMLRFH